MSDSSVGATKTVSDGSSVGGREPAEHEPAPGPPYCYEQWIGTLVEVTPDRGLVVEYNGPNGEIRRPAISLAPVEASAVGLPVELGFVEGDFDRPVLTKVTGPADWRAVLQTRWNALGRKVFGVEPGSWTLVEVLEEVKALVFALAWVWAGGNITHAAARCDCSRRLFRERLRPWQAQNPRLLPRDSVMLRLAKERRKAEARHTREEERLLKRRRRAKARATVDDEQAAAASHEGSTSNG